MKHLWQKFLFALMVAALLLSAVALAEEAFDEIDVIEETEAVEPVDALVEEQSVDIVEEDTLGGDEVSTYAGETYAAAPSNELFAAAGEVAINAANFPDASFRDYITYNLDTDYNGSLSASEIASVVSMNAVVNSTDLTGIKYFTSLQYLNFASTVTSLDVSGMTSLTKIEWSAVSYSTIFDNPTSKLTTLNISGCTGLEKLELYTDQLTSLDASNCTNLKRLDCSFSQMTSLNVSGCTNLEWLECNSCQMTSLNLSGLSNLIRVFCNNNQITWINVDGCTELFQVSFFNNQLGNDAIRYLAGALPKLGSLDCRGNPITSLPLSSLKKLTSLYCSNLNLTSLNLSGFTNLGTLDCSNLNLTSLNLSGLTNLTGLNCSNNKLKTLDISNCKKMESLECGNNKIKKLDISSCKNLLTSYTKGKHTTRGGQEIYNYDVGREDLIYYLSVDKGVKIITKSSSSSSSSSKTKLASKKQKVTAYVGTPVQMETNGETGKSFKSSNKKIATVNSKGVVTPKKAGKCKITYKTASASYTVTLTVKDLTIPKYVVLNLKGTIAAKVGEPQTLTATMNDGAVSKLKWTTSNKKIATVKNGVVTFKKKGTVTITVTTVKGKKKAKVKFKVTK